jgi:carboxymethylenebutenolidase
MNQLSNVVSRLPEGFAAAVRPVTATTITTGSTGLITGEVSIPSGDIHIPAWRAMPDHGILFPTVLVIHEIFGVHEHIKDLCRRLAKDGYLAIAPYLYAREGDVSNLSDVQELYAKVVSHVPDAQVMKDLDATVNWAGKNGSDTSRLAVTGFCWGGRTVWLYAAHTDAPRAGAAWYGRLTSAPTPLQPKRPIDVASDLQFPVIGFYGGKDHSIPLEAVEAMRTAIEAAHKSAVIHVYPEAQHGFNADYRPGYDETAAKDAWAKMLAFFKQQGV